MSDHIPLSEKMPVENQMEWCDEIGNLLVFIAENVFEKRDIPLSQPGGQWHSEIAENFYLGSLLSL